MERDKLDAMKYGELQKLAKDLGLKANGKKKDLLDAIIQHEGSSEKEEIVTDVEIPLVPMEESKLDATFEMDESKENALNETFEKEKGKLNDTFDKENPENDKILKISAPRFVEFSAKKGENREKRKSSRRSSILASSPNNTSLGASIVKSIKAGRKSSVATPKVDYLTKKNKTPLRGVAKTPASIMKKESAKKPRPASKLPRFVEFAQSRKPKLGKVPDFAKMHEKNFQKMESLTDTVTKQLDRAKAITQNHNNLVKKIQDRKTPGKTPATKTSNKTPSTSAKSPTKFNPVALTTAKMNLNFGGTTQQSINAPFQFSAKPSGAPIAKVAPRQRKDPKTMTTMAKSKTPVAAKKRPSLSKAAKDTPDGKVVLGNITNRSLVGTPGKKFDIKASLARPLKYKPHKGKLAPLVGKVKEGKDKDITFSETKQRQMAVIKGVRLNKRAELMMKNRQMD